MMTEEPNLDGFDFDIFYGGPAPRAAYADQFFQDYYPDFQPYDNPTATTRPPFYEPGMSAAQRQSWLNELLNRGVTEAEKFLRYYVGKVTNSFFDKFLIEVYPYALLHAKNTGLAVLVFWFGDVLRVEPDGHWGLVYERIGDLAAFMTYVQHLSHSDYFSVLLCPRGSEDLPNGCQWPVYGSPGLRLVAGKGGGGILLVAAIVAGIWLGPKLVRGLK